MKDIKIIANSYVIGKTQQQNKMNISITKGSHSLKKITSMDGKKRSVSLGSALRMRTNETGSSILQRSCHGSKMLSEIKSLLVGY